MEGLCGGTWCAVIRAQRDLPAYPSFHLGTLFPFLSHQLWVVCLTFHQHWQQSVIGQSRIHFNSCNWWSTTKSSERYLLRLNKKYTKNIQPAQLWSCWNCLMMYPVQQQVRFVSDLAWTGLTTLMTSCTAWYKDGLGTKIIFKCLVEVETNGTQIHITTHFDVS